MKEHPEHEAFSVADRDVAEQMVAFLLRCAETKRQYSDPYVMSEITAKRVIEGLQRSGFVLVKRAPQTPSQPPPSQLYLL